MAAQEVTESLRTAKSGITFSQEYADIGMKSQVYGRPDIDPAEYIDRKQLRFMGDAAKCDHGRSSLGRSSLGRSSLGRSSLGRASLGRSSLGRSSLGRSSRLDISASRLQISAIYLGISAL